MKKTITKNTLTAKSTAKKNVPNKTTFDKSNYFDVIAIAIICLLGLLIYSNSFDCTFHLDDMASIVDNEKIKNLADLKSIWNYNHNRFVANLTFALNYHFNGLQVWGYHLFNICIHLLNSVVVYWLTLLLFSSAALKENTISNHKKTFALITALLFVSHPLATQSVTYIIQRMAALVTLFYILSITLYVKARITENHTVTKYMCFAGALLAALLAMYTKENAFTLPFAIVLIELFFLQSKKLSINLKDYRIAILIVALIGFAIYILSTFSFNVFKPLPPDVYNNYTEITSANYLFTQFSALVKYLQLLVLPIQQNLDYDFYLSQSFFEIKTVLSFVLLVALLVSGVYLFNKNRIISFGIFWFFLTIAIESSIVPIADLIFEHRTYLPSYGFFLMVTAGIFSLLWDKNKTMAISLFALIICTNSMLSFQRNKIWKDPLTLWTDVIKKSPNKARPYLSRGNAYKDLNQMENAIADFNTTITLQPKYTLAYTNRGYCYKSLGNWQKGIEDYNQSIAMDPNNPLAYSNRGVIYGNLKQWDKAIADYTTALQRDPNFVIAYSNRAMVYGNLEQWDKAMTDCSKAIAINPNYGAAYANRGAVYEKIGKPDSALVDYTKSIELSPKSAGAYFNRGSVYLDRGQWVKAVNDYTVVLQLDPSNKDALSAREYAYQQMNLKKNF